MSIWPIAGAETWKGRHPALTAATVLNIARQAEMVFNYSGHYQVRRATVALTGTSFLHPKLVRMSCSLGGLTASQGRHSRYFT